MMILHYRLSNLCECGTTTTELGNVAFKVRENKSEVIKNRELLSSLINIKKERMIFVYQHHSNIINKVDENNLHAGENDFISGVDGDALYTYTPQLAILIFHADCVPIMFIDESTHLVGIIHAGFIGTNNQATYHCLQTLIANEKIDPKNIKVVIGPCRRKNDYLVNDEEKEIIVRTKNEKYLSAGCFDMVKANIEQLLKCGVLETNIIDSEINTVKDDRFFSVHKKSQTGRLASYIYLK